LTRCLARDRGARPRASWLDSGIAARVTVEVRLRAAAEVNDGAPSSGPTATYGVNGPGETDAFASIGAAQAAVGDWVHAYDTVRLHQLLNMGISASLSVAGPANRVLTAETGDPDESTGPVTLEAPPAVNTAPWPIEMEARACHRRGLWSTRNCSSRFG
jgi:hypothetical protein